ncbi:MAG: polyamine ABC transporter substrate-binding protein [Chromatiales bacterium]|nr:polyamine ABC transporter substrate-binding protein [Chromatiales bacterium]
MRTLCRGLLAALFLFPLAVLAEDKVVHVYNWSDYIADDVVKAFEEKTGIKVVYDVYDANEVMEAKLLAGRSGYDVVFPTAHPFAERHIQAGIYRKLDRTLLPNARHLDPSLMKKLASVDPGNQYVMPYMWGTTGIGYNVEKVEAALGKDAPVDSWRLIFDPANAAKLASCGIAVLDDEEAMMAALFHLGKDPNSAATKDIEAAAAFQKVRRHIRYFHSSKYINDLANGEICVALGYSGDVLQARDRAEEADKGVEIGYSIPQEGAVVWFDVMAIPADAPHPNAAHAFIDFLMVPENIAAISNEVAYANANAAATELVDEDIRNDPGVYPPAEVMERLVTVKTQPANVQRLKVRTWSRIKTGR